MTVGFLKYRLIFLAIGTLLLVGAITQQDAFKVMSLMTVSAIFFAISVFSSIHLSDLANTLKRQAKKVNEW